MSIDTLLPFAEGFSATGHPVHTRCLEIELAEAQQGRVRVSGRIVDLRKHGFVPTGGDLQTSGFIHDMSLDLWLDPSTRVIDVAEPSQSVVAFESSPRTGGESCRDITHHLRDLAGVRLDDDFQKRLTGCFGGPLGCSHLLTLTQLMASTARTALVLEAESAPHRAAREMDERIFKRSLVLDGLEQGAGRAMVVTVQQNDVHTGPYAAMASPLDRFLFQHEVRVLAQVDMRTMTFSSITGEERTRGREELGTRPWESRADALAPLVGAPAIYGLTRVLLDRYAGDTARRSLLDALLNIAPGLIQCMAAMAHRMVEGAPSTDGDEPEGPTIQQLGGRPDSCYIWRAGGPGLARRQMPTGGHDAD
jgi:hypothetical protein